MLKCNVILNLFFSHLQGTVHIVEHVNVNMPELAKGCFPAAVPCGSEKNNKTMTNMNEKSQKITQYESRIGQLKLTK